MLRFRVPLVLAFLALLGGASFAVGQARISDDAAATASPLAPTLERVDEALRQRLTSADDAASRWMAGELETLDPAARTRQFGAAAARVPGELLYQASLARACVPRTVPSLPECDARDTVASFATRDPDNAVPWLLLAERARQRRLPASVDEYLERAATSPRFDDYTERGAPLFAAAIRAASGGSAGAVVVAAAGYVDRASGGLAPALAALCGSKREIAGETAVGACRRIAALMVERAPNAVDRALGASIATANAPTDSARAAAETKAREIAVRRQRCAETFQAVARLAANPAGTQRAGIENAALAWAGDRATVDEFTACERLARAIATTK